MTRFILTANHLAKGHVVFLDDNGSWVTSVDLATRVATPEQIELLEREIEITKASNHVIDPYLVEVVLEADAIIPVKTRERVRTLGPTVRPDLGYQADIRKVSDVSLEGDDVRI